MADGGSVQRVRLATGIEVSYVERGDPGGAPLLLLHAWVESLGSFDRLLPVLPDSIHAFAFDQRGHGTSDKPALGYTLADAADDAVAFMEALELPAAVVLGSSSGGYVAQQIALSRPDRVLGLILVGSPWSLHGRPPFADEVDRLTDPIDRAWVEASLLWFKRSREVPDWYLQDRVEDGVRVPADIWRRSLAGLVEAQPPTGVGVINAPTLVIWGGRDELLSRADEEALVASIPGARLVVYDDTGHLVLWEHPERIAAEVVAFVG
jgi:pimeloyl-ACP methyl ester carboxylesterase